MKHASGFKMQTKTYNSILAAQYTSCLPIYKTLERSVQMLYEILTKNLWQSMKYGFCSQLGPAVYFRPKKTCWSTFLNIHQTEICFRQKSQTLCRKIFCNVHISYVKKQYNKATCCTSETGSLWVHHLVHTICNQTSGSFSLITPS